MRNPRGCVRRLSPGGRRSGAELGGLQRGCAELEPQERLGYTAFVHKEEATLPTSCLAGAEVRLYVKAAARLLAARLHLGSGGGTAFLCT